MHNIVRYTTAESFSRTGSLPSIGPFSIRGAPNVILETVKRGEDDLFSSSEDEKDLKKPKTLVLRIYEALGGHAQAFLRINGRGLEVAKAYETNILEDNISELGIFSASDEVGINDIEIKLDFRGFEVKTVKLILGKGDMRDFEKK